ncbi:MAG: CAP domain-containing protein [Patescibacteria group bacterium]|nr:CAP domain-containing protein [Patescibacteria group bacterium]MDD4611350.1 CAP domain-containing protein [Patescibacteria group bacterium]
MFKKIFTIFCLIFFLLALTPGTLAGTNNLAKKLAGRILLQVESRGEIWYVDPQTYTRYFLGNSENTPKIIAEISSNIFNKDLAKIPVGLIAKSTAKDSDSDGLSDDLEISLGSNPTKADTDSDGYNDSEEIKKGYNIFSRGRASYDKNFAKSYKGKILLQVESGGDAWYVNPLDGKRYFLGSGKEIYSNINSFGTGIKNKDLNEIIASAFDYSNSTSLERLINRSVNIERVKRGIQPLKWNNEVAAVAREHSLNLAHENEELTGIGMSCDFPFIHHEGLDFGLYQSDRLKNRNIYYFNKTAENIALVPRAEFTVGYDTETAAAKSGSECQSKQLIFSGVSKKIESKKVTEEKMQIIKKEIAERKSALGKETELNILETRWLDEDLIAREIVAGWMASSGHKKNILNADYDESGIGVSEVNGYTIATQVFIKRANCGYKEGECCRKKGYYSYCLQGWKCIEDICL